MPSVLSVFNDFLMIHRLRLLSLLLALLAASTAPAWAQGNVRVVLRRPPPNQLRVADLWKVDLDNRTQETFTIYLHGFATEEFDGLIVDARSSQFRLPPGKLTVSGEQISPITVNESNDDYKDEIVRSGTLRSGNYRVCVEVLLASNDSLLATDCYDQTVQLLSPPILVSPVDGDRVEERLPTFTWLPPAPLERGNRISYRIQIVEKLGRQSAYDAIRSNPEWFIQTGITRTLVQYPLRARAFQYGREYAWMITALETSRTGREFIVGESEVWHFLYDSLRTTPERPTRDRGGVVPIITTRSDTGFGFIPRTTPFPIGYLPGNQSPYMIDNEFESAGIQAQLSRADLIKAAILVNIPQLVLKEMLRSCNEGD